MPLDMLIDCTHPDQCEAADSAANCSFLDTSGSSFISLAWFCTLKHELHGSKLELLFSCNFFVHLWCKGVKLQHSSTLWCGLPLDLNRWDFCSEIASSLLSKGQCTAWTKVGFWVGTCSVLWLHESKPKAMIIKLVKTIHKTENDFPI